MSHWWEVSGDQPESTVGIGKLTGSNRFITKQQGFVFHTQMEYPEGRILVCRVPTKSLEVAEAGMLPTHVFSSCLCFLG